MTHLLLENRQAPGDAAVVTAAVRALHDTYPEEYTVHVAGTCPDVWRHADGVADGLAPGGAIHLNIGYTQGINASNQTRGHFAHAVVTDLATKLRRPVRMRDMRPALKLAADEGPVCGLEPGKYWVMMAGGKSDFTSKLWGYSRWQRVVDSLKGEVAFVQAGARTMGSKQRGLKSVVDLVGQTKMREYMRLIRYAAGVVCPVTSAMHFAAGFNVPCVVVAGGREPWWWEAYTPETWHVNCGTDAPADFVPHAYLHTLGELGCCSTHGCWRAGVGEKKANNCVDVVKGVERVPHCLALLTPDRVADTIRGISAGLYPPFDRVPEWLGALIVPKAAGAAPARANPRAVKHRPPRYRRDADTGMLELRPPAIGARRIVPCQPTTSSVLQALQPPVRVYCEGTGAFKERDLAVAAALETHTPTGSVGGGSGWSVWLGTGVRPRGPGWLQRIAIEAAKGAQVVAGRGDAWVAASAARADEVARGASWRTLLPHARRIRDMLMETDKPGEYV